MQKIKGTIKNVVELRQREKVFYLFSLPASQLVELGRVERLGDKSGGVQRSLDDRRSASIGMAMQDEHTYWLDNFIVHLGPQDSWRYVNGAIEYDEHFFLSVDDGQHREYGLQVLTDEELASLGSLPVVAGCDLTFEERLEIFLQQELRKHIDRNLLLQGKHTLDKWPSDRAKQSYEIVLRLGHHPDSPLHGRILFDEVGLQQRGTKHRIDYIQSVGLWNTIKSILTSRSILYNKPESTQLDIVWRWLSHVANLWPDRWQQRDDFMLCSARGVNALLKLFCNSNTLRMIMVDGDFSDARLRSVLSYIASYDWAIESQRNRSDDQITKDLDDLMSRKMASRMRRRDREAERGGEEK